MFEAHPSAEAFDRFLLSTSQTGRHTNNPQVMRHLLSDCAVCRDRLISMGWSKPRLARLLQLTAKDDLPEAEAVPAYDYSRSFAAADQAVSAFLLLPSRATEIPVATFAGRSSSLAGRRARSRTGPAEPAVLDSPGLDPGSWSTAARRRALQGRRRDAAVRRSGSDRRRGLFRPIRREARCGGRISSTQRLGTVTASVFARQRPATMRPRRRWRSPGSSVDAREPRIPCCAPGCSKKRALRSLVFPGPLSTSHRHA